MTRLAPAHTVGDALFADLFVRLERLEGEVRQLRHMPERERKTLPQRAVQPTDHNDDTRPLFASSAPTPLGIPWPKRIAPDERELLDVAATMSADAFVGVDGAGMVRVWNRAAEELFGWRFDDVVGRPVPFLAPDQRAEHLGLLSYPQSVIAGQDLSTIRLRRDGIAVPVRLRLQEGPRGSVVFAFREDVPQYPVAPDPRPAMEPPQGPIAAPEVEAGLQSFVTLGRCAAGVAHDMNNVLSVLQGYGELLREQSRESRLSAMAGDIAYAAEQGGAVCRNLLSILKPEAGTPPQTDLVAVLRRSERIWRTILGEGTALTLTLPAGPAMARIHPGEFFQVVLNLMTNAADALAQGGTLAEGGTVGLALTVVELAVGPAADLPAGRYVEIAVADDGPGMPSEIVERLGRFAGTTRPAANHGLGLMTIREILVRNRGSIAVSAGRDRGTAIRVHLREA